LGSPEEDPLKAFDTENLDPKELKGRITKFNRLKAELFGPELIDLKHNLKEVVLMKFEESSKELKKLLAKHDSEINEKCVFIEIAMENYETIQKRHKEFVEHLEEVFANISKQIETVDNKVTFV